MEKRLHNGTLARVFCIWAESAMDSYGSMVLVIHRNSEHLLYPVYNG